MTDPTDYDDVESLVEDNRETIKRVLRHSANPFARACAWALIDAGSDEPDLERLRKELDALQEAEV